MIFWQTFFEFKFAVGAKENPLQITANYPQFWGPKRPDHYPAQFMPRERPVYMPGLPNDAICLLSLPTNTA